MLGQSLYEQILPYGTLLIAVIVAAITAIYSLKGKKLDAGEWITESLRDDAETHREELKGIVIEFEEFKKKVETERKEATKEREEAATQIEILRIAVASLKIREKELIAYLTLVEKEVQILRELLVLQGSATPDSNLTIKTISVLDNQTISFVEELLKDFPEEKNE